MGDETSSVDVTFFIDRSIGGKVVAAVLRNTGARVECHDDHFDHKAKDTIWIPYVGERGWVAISKDAAIKRRVIEKAAVREWRLALFVLKAKNFTGLQMGELLANALPKMYSILKKRRPPFIAFVTRSGIRIDDGWD